MTDILTQMMDEAHDHIHTLRNQDTEECDQIATFLERIFGPPPKRAPKPLRDGYYWFKCERASHRTIAQLVKGEWYTTNDVGPIKLEVLNARGWELDEKVKDEKEVR